MSHADIQNATVHSSTGTSSASCRHPLSKFPLSSCLTLTFPQPMLIAGAVIGSFLNKVPLPQDSTAL